MGVIAKIPFLLAIFHLHVTIPSKIPCKAKDFGYGSIVCICDETHCDNLEPLGQIPNGYYFRLTSTKNGQRFNSSFGHLSHEPFRSIYKPSHNINEEKSSPNRHVRIDRAIKYQRIIGFGGAFTDSAGINLGTLKESLQNTLIENYFGKNGIEYNMGRIPIAGTDFSTRGYSYADKVQYDKSLKHFSLVEEDFQYKIPYIRKALNLNPRIKLFASAWSSPTWMKTNGQFNGMGILKSEFKQTWANYLVKFLDEYAKQGIDIWALTTENEPLAGFIPFYKWNCLGFTAKMMKEFIIKYLGPTLARSDRNQTKLIILDDNRPSITHWTRTILGDPESAKYVSGIGIHWYMNWLFGTNALEFAHEEFPNYFMLGTEACNGYLPFEAPVLLGSWERGEKYASDIIENLNHWVSGWVDWNLYLSMNGGPNWAKNEVDSPIIIDSATNTAYKQPMFYALGHFTKYLPEDSVRINHSSDDLGGLEIISFQRPDNKIVIVLLNKNEREISLNLTDSISGNIKIQIEPSSINTLLYE